MARWAAFIALASAADAQVFVRNDMDVPDQTGGSNRFTENVDFGDIDLDGDFDVALSQGGDFGNLQDRLWVNRGGIQGGILGRFRDATATQFPAITRDGRDIEFVDFDNDADLDIYVSNTSTTSNQTNLWWTNMGGVQGGTLGNYTDETGARWVGLGGPGSSIAPSLLVGGGFIDWSCDCDFGDLDNDGDMDLVHSTYGGSFSGVVPTRIFLNDGAGHFSEFNPSGFQLAGSMISNGNPGIWCEGTFQTNTSNTTGTNCDISTNTLDIDVGDVDGDFDLDILHGDRNSNPRFFYNRLEENGGTLGFRDVTNYVYPPGYAAGTGHYEQEMGDLDGDQTLDIYGLNWGAAGFGLDDVTMLNDGTGRFGNLTVLPSSGSDDNEGDFGDYDNDGDLDLLVANFSGNDRLYQNNGLGALGYVAPATSGLNGSGLGGYSSLDADWCDVDEDGDYDYFSAQDGTNPVVYWQNQTGVPDTTAPKVGPVEALGAFTAGVTGTPDRVVRAHVYDNAAYYITWYNPTRIEVELDGCLIDTLPARSSGGQVFRAEIPSNLVGDVSYRFVSEDQYGNQGTSATTTYTASTALVHETVYGTPQLGPGGVEYELHGSGILTPGKPWYAIIDTKGPNFFVLGFSLAPTAPTVDPALGVVNIDAGQAIWLSQGGTDANGCARQRFDVPDEPFFGLKIYGQIFVPNLTFTAFDSSRGLEVEVLE